MKAGKAAGYGSERCPAGLSFVRDRSRRLVVPGKSEIVYFNVPALALSIIAFEGRM